MVVEVNEISARSDEMGIRGKPFPEETFGRGVGSCLHPDFRKDWSSRHLTGSTKRGSPKS